MGFADGAGGADEFGTGLADGVDGYVVGVAFLDGFSFPIDIFHTLQ